MLQRSPVSLSCFWVLESHFDKSPTSHCASLKIWIFLVWCRGSQMVESLWWRTCKLPCQSSTKLSIAWQILQIHMVQVSKWGQVCTQVGTYRCNTKAVQTVSRNCFSVSPKFQRESASSAVLLRLIVPRKKTTGPLRLLCSFSSSGESQDLLLSCSEQKV